MVHSPSAFKGQKTEARTQSRSPTYVAETQLLETSTLPTRVCVTKNLKSGVTGRQVTVNGWMIKGCMLTYSQYFCIWFHIFYNKTTLKRHPTL